MTTRTMFLAGYVLIAVVLIGLQIVASRRPDRVARLGDVVAATKRRRIGWLALVVAWWWVGFHVFARSSVLEQ